MGKIYLSSYYTRDYGIDEEVTYINIARKDMAGVDEKIIELAPSKELFSWYWNHKSESNWFDYYKKEYKLQVIARDKNARRILLELRERVMNGENICLLCFCRRSDKCHRGIVGDMFRNYGIEVIDTDL